jgi:hypothetical protein
MTAHVWDWSHIVSPDLVERALAHEADALETKQAGKRSKSRQDANTDTGGMTRAIAAA